MHIDFEEGFVEYDDAKIASSLRAVGLSDWLVAPPPGEPTTVLRTATTVGHYVAFVLWANQPRKADNGYMLVGWLRSRVSLGDARKSAMQLAREQLHAPSVPQSTEFFGDFSRN